MWLVGSFLLPLLGIKPQFLGRLDFTVVNVFVELSHNTKELKKIVVLSKHNSDD